MEHYSKLFTKANNVEFLKHNRYGEVLPFKDNIVELKVGENAGLLDFYVNASYVSSGVKGGEQAFIATQGPMGVTEGRFW